MIIPSITSSEMYEVMVSFAKKQPEPISIPLTHVLNGKKPFRLFKEKMKELGIGNHWCAFEQDAAKRSMTEWLEEVSKSDS